MNFFEQILNAIKFGGVVMYPLLALLFLAMVLIIDKILLYKKLVKLPKSLLQIIETYNFSWDELEVELGKISNQNYYKKFFTILVQNKSKPIWWIDSRAADEAKLIEKSLSCGMWILETVVTVAPLLGLLGTIFGMMDSFKLIGNDSLINPSGVTAGVAESLIATAFGLVIAVVTLFAFNYFSRKQDQVLDELERLGTRVVDHIKLDCGEK